jgi:hypothetical protein
MEDCLTSISTSARPTVPVLPLVVPLPTDKSKLLYGIEPTILTREDMTSNYSWWKLASKNSSYKWKLGAKDFVEHDTYIKYFLLSLGLLEHSVILIGGLRRSGKSMFMAWFTYQLVRLFGKNATLDWGPPEPKYFGRYRELYDQDYIDEIVDGFNRLTLIQKKEHRQLTQIEKESFILYNAVLGLDECDDSDRQTQNNLTQLKARILRRAGHFAHICAAMVMIDIDRFAPVLKSKTLVTHTVDCTWEGHYPGYSSILIHDERPNGTGLYKYLWLKPEDWTHLWDSHSASQITHDVEVHFGNKPKKKKQEDN